MLFELAIIFLYLTFALDLVIWPISSGSSTSALVKQNTYSGLPLIIMLIRHLFSLIIYLAPLFISLLALLDIIDREVNILTWITGIFFILAGRVISLFGTYNLRNKDAAVVKTSVFRWSRHPIALGMIISLFGFILVSGYLFLLVGYPLYILNMHHKLKIEEGLLTDQFGDDYKIYMKETPRYI